MKYWRQFPISLTLECVEMGALVNIITRILLKCMAKYGGLLVEEFWFMVGVHLVVMEILCSKDTTPGL
jgi:hypothetical protein